MRFIHGQAGKIARFLQNSYTNILHFYTDLLYPGENVKVRYFGDQAHILNAWEGPQLQVPNQIELEKVACVFVPSVTQDLVDQVISYGFPKEKVFSMKEIFREYVHFFESGGIKPTIYGCVNLALRDLSLIAANNRFRETKKISMIAQSIGIDRF